MRSQQEMDKDGNPVKEKNIHRNAIVSGQNYDMRITEVPPEVGEAIVPVCTPQGTTFKGTIPTWN
jgi:hypothetical protein